MNKSPTLRGTAPGLFSSLLKILSPIELATVEKNYEEVVSGGGAEEFPVVRDVGASFNPRPARIAAIVLADGKPTNQTKAIILAFWSCLIKERELLGLQAVIPDTVFPSLLRIESSSWSGNKDIDEVIVALAIQLDRIRHLHMTNLSPAQKSAALLKAEELVGAILSNHTELPILQKVTHAIHQQRRVLGES